MSSYDDDDTFFERIDSFIYRQSKLLKRASLVISLVGFILLVTGAATSSTTDPLFIIGICATFWNTVWCVHLVQNS